METQEVSLRRRRRSVLVLSLVWIILAGFSSGCGVKQRSARPTPNAAAAPDNSKELNGPYYASGQGGDKFQSMSTSGCLTTCTHPAARMQGSIGVPLHFDVNPNSAVQIPTATGYVPGAYSGTAGSAAGDGAGRVNTLGAPNTKGGMLGNRDLKLIERQQR